MCGRFTFTRPDLDELVRELDAEVDAGVRRSHRPRWNIAPGTDHCIVQVVDGRRCLVPARFGIERSGGGLVINARAETAAELPTFRDAHRHARCVVPADGFYEWQGGRADRQALWFHPPAGGLLFLAGLAFRHRGGRAFVILTTPANDLVRAVHGRMPALLSREAAQAWLSPGEPVAPLPAPEHWLAAREVSTRVNDASNDGPELVAPSPRRQLTLV